MVKVPDSYFYEARRLKKRVSTTGEHQVSRRVAERQKLDLLSAADQCRKKRVLLRQKTQQNREWSLHYCKEFPSVILPKGSSYTRCNRAKAFQKSPSHSHIFLLAPP